MENQNDPIELKYISDYNKLSRDEKIEYFIIFIDTFNFKSEPKNEEEKKKLYLFNTYRDNINNIFLTEGLFTFKKVKRMSATYKIYAVTPKHTEVLRIGGWMKYIAEIQEEKKRRKKLDNLTINNYKIQFLIAGLTILIISINCYFDYQSLKLNKSSSKDKEIINEVKELRNALLIQNKQIERILKNNKPIKKDTTQVH